MSIWDDPEFQRWERHPNPTPDDLSPNVFCYNPPSIFKSSARFRLVRDRLLLDLERDPLPDPDDLKKLRQIELILAYRETVPVAERFWEPDPPYYMSGGSSLH